MAKISVKSGGDLQFCVQKHIFSVNHHHPQIYLVTPQGAPEPQVENHCLIACAEPLVAKAFNNLIVKSKTQKLLF